MLSSYAIDVSDEDYTSIATQYQWQVPTQAQALDVALFHYKNMKFVLEFTNEATLKLANKKIEIIDVQDETHNVKVKECAGSGDNEQKRFVSKKPFNNAIKLMRFVIEI